MPSPSLALSISIYLSPPEAVRQEITELLARIEVLKFSERKADAAIVDAVLGGVEKPRIMLSDMFSEYEQTQRTTLSKNVARSGP